MTPISLHVDEKGKPIMTGIAVNLRKKLPILRTGIKMGSNPHRHKTIQMQILLKFYL